MKARADIDHKPWHTFCIKSHHLLSKFQNKYSDTVLIYCQYKEMVVNCVNQTNIMESMTPYYDRCRTYLIIR